MEQLSQKSASSIHQFKLFDQANTQPTSYFGYEQTREEKNKYQQLSQHKKPTAKMIELHQRAVSVSKTYLKAEAELISIFQELDKTRAYIHFGASSLTAYGIEILKLSEGAAANIVTVARKSVELPALKAAIQNGEITLNKARRIAQVLTKDNQEKWLSLAKVSSSRVIEREVAKENPILAIRERIHFKAQNRLELKCGISEALSEKISEPRNLIAQKKRKQISLEEMLEVIVPYYIEHEDPIAKAKRAKVRSEAKRTQILKDDPELASIENRSEDEVVIKPKCQSSREDESSIKANSILHSNVKTGTCRAKRSPLHSALKHAVVLRDLRQCTFINQLGRRCPHTKWLDVHHIVPIAKGGTNELSNLTTLCSAHHRMLHH